jgi:hypothetical protein
MLNPVVVTDGQTAHTPEPAATDTTTIGATVYGRGNTTGTSADPVAAVRVTDCLPACTPSTWSCTC